jgi:S1-C subfamily serine protease
MVSPVIQRAAIALLLFGAGVVSGAELFPRRRAEALPLHQEAPTVAPVASSRPLRAQAREPEPVPPREIARRALSSTVFLRGGRVYGAGIVLDGAGHVLTCDHVIDGLDHVEAFFDGDPAAIPVEIIERDHDADLALLALTGGLPPNHAAVAVGSITDVAMGDPVYTMGAPRKMRFSLSHGIVSYVGRSFDGTFYVQTDLAANAGSSGGPVMNERGELIGVASFILHGSEGLTFAVPIDYAFERFGSKLGGPAHDGRRFHEWLDAQSRAVPPKT